MPGENSVGLSFLDAFQHVVEDRTAGNFGSLALDEFRNDVELLSDRKLRQNSES